MNRILLLAPSLDDLLLSMLETGETCGFDIIEMVTQFNPVLFSLCDGIVILNSLKNYAAEQLKRIYIALFEMRNPYLVVFENNSQEIISDLLMSKQIISQAKKLFYFMNESSKINYLDNVYNSQKNEDFYKFWADTEKALTI